MKQFYFESHEWLVCLFLYQNPDTEGGSNQSPGSQSTGNERREPDSTEADQPEQEPVSQGRQSSERETTHSPMDTSESQGITNVEIKYM